MRVEPVSASTYLGNGEAYRSRYRSSRSPFPVLEIAVMSSNTTSATNATVAQPGFNIEDATFVSLFVESVLYGMFVLLFALAMSVLLGKRKRTASGTRPLLAASITMFLMGTLVRP